MGLIIYIVIIILLKGTTINSYNSNSYTNTNYNYFLNSKYS